MIDTNNSEWLTGLKNSAAAAKEKDAIKAHSAEQRQCVNGHSYLFPYVIHPDAGAIFDAGITGKHRIKPIAVCPECRTRIET